MAPPLSRWGEEGFSSRSTCPRHRAVAITPPECPAASARCDGPCCLRLSIVRLGLRICGISGPPVRSLSLRPGDSLTILAMASSVGFRVLVSLHPATRVTGLWLLPRRGCLPLNTSAFSGRTIDNQLKLRGLFDSVFQRRSAKMDRGPMRAPRPGAMTPTRSRSAEAHRRVASGSSGNRMGVHLSPMRDRSVASTSSPCGRTPRSIHATRSSNACSRVSPSNPR